MRKTFTLATALFAIATSAQVSNGGFEAVLVPFDPELPTLAYNWSFMSDFGAALVDDAHSGDYALSVWNWYWYAEGAANNGLSVWTGADGLPVTGRPQQLTGWFKREEGDLQEGEENDAVVRVLMTHWNSTTLQRDTVGSGVHLFGEQAAWEPFTLAIDYAALELPDTLVIQIASCGNCICTGASTGNCAYFYVDDLALTSTTGISDALMDDRTVRLLPQGDGSAVVRVAAHTSLPFRLQLWDALGRTAGDVRVIADGQRIQLPSAPGVVLFDASTAQGRVARGRVVVE